MSVICFDLWGTIVRPKISTSYQDVLVSYGVRREEIYPFVRSEIMNHAIGYKEMEFLLRNKFGIPVSSSETIMECWRRENESSVWVDDAQLLLTQLSSRHTLVLVSNCTMPGWQSVENKLGVSKFFHRTFLSWRQGMSKPESKVWLTIEDWYPNDGRFWMIGDTEDDIHTPNLLGWGTFLVKSCCLKRLRRYLAWSEMDKEVLKWNG